MTLVEIALDDAAGARTAQEAGASRIELCGVLAVAGGVTPSIGLVDQVAGSGVHIPVMALIRPRGGDFVYSADELHVMVRDIKALRQFGVGFVIGALTPDGSVDGRAVRRLLEAAEDAPTTFHRAIDSTRDIAASADSLAEMGIGRVLTSGGRATALEGAGVLHDLVARTAGRLTIVAGGSVRPATVAHLVAQTGVTEVHLRAGVERSTRAVWSAPGQDYDAMPVSETEGRIVCATVRALAGAPA